MMWTSNLILSLGLLCFTNIWQLSLSNDALLENSSGIGNDEIMDDFSGIGSDEIMEDFSEIGSGDIGINFLSGEFSENFLNENKCKRGWKQFKNHCYFFSNGRINTWDNAKLECVQTNSYLAEINNEEENDFIRGIINSEVWIGGTRKDKEWYWTTTNNKISYTKWATGEPNNWHYGENCVELKTGYGFWNDVPCHNKNDYLCEYKLGQSIGNLIEEETEGSGEEEEAEGSGEVEETEILIEEQHCKEGWEKYNSNCYYFSGMEISWESAKESCANKNSRLADVYSKEENAFIRRNNPRYDLWIGGNDMQKEGEWRWTNGKNISFTNWENPEPNNWYGEDCLVIRSYHGLWNDLHCHKSNRYVCKYNLEASVESSKEEKVESPKEDKICKDGWEKFKNHCYYFSDTMDGWKFAKTSCEEKDSRLADINNKEENTFIRGHDQDYDLWIGGNDIEKEGDWRWTNGKRLNFTNWEYTEPNNWYLEDCLIMRSPHGLWNDLHCQRFNLYVCKYNIEHEENVFIAEPEENVINEKNCKDGWKKFKNHCYYFSFTTSNWENAKETCEDKASHLADVHNKEENSFIRGNSRHDLWIGGNDKVNESTWRWTNEDKLSYTNWENIEPNNWNGEDCLIIRRNHGLWNDLDCYKHNNFVCKYNLEASVESSKEEEVVSPEEEASVESSKEEEVVSPEEGKNCKDGWEKFKNHCYYFSDTTDNWKFAKTSCEEKDSHLADIYNKEENNFIRGNNPDYDLWIGGNDIEKDREWHWTNGRIISFTNWEDSEPNNYYGEDCLIMRSTHGLWNDLHCHRFNRYVCKYNIEASVGSSKEEEVESPKEVDQNCKGGWEKFKNHCYYFSGMTANWNFAKTSCEEKNSYLADVYNKEENTFMRGNSRHDLWIGGNDKVNEGTWRWTNENKISYTNWENIEPNNWNGEDCLIIRRNHGLWNDLDCDKHNNYVCKYKLGASVESSKETEVKSPEEGGLCREGWISFGNSCYYFENIFVNWDSALTLCKQLESHLVDIKTEEENYFLIKHTLNDAWTSGNDWQQEGDWRWGNGKPVTYKKWRYGEPNNARYQENCMVIIGVTNNEWIKSYWYDDPCLHRHAFICKYNIAEAKANDAEKACVEEDKESISGTENTEETAENFSGTETGSAEETVEVFSGIGSEETKESFSGTGSEETKESFSGTGSEETEESYSESKSEETEVSFSGSGESGPNEDKETTEEVETPFVKLTTPEQFFFTEPEEFEVETSANNKLELCKNGWFPFMNSCYKVEYDYVNWYEADKICKSEGSHLVHITNELESKYLERHSQIGLSRGAWIGAKKSSGSINWAWTNELPIIYNNWIYPEMGPESVDEECASIRGNPRYNPFKIYRAKCNAALPFVCKKKAKAEPGEFKFETSEIKNLELCDGWLSRREYCYYFGTKGESWPVAENICLEKNSTLVKIENNDEVHYLTVLLGTDMWIKGPSWHFDYETEDKGSECVFLRIIDNDEDFALWKPENCNSQKSFICESPLNNEALREMNLCETGAPWMNPYNNHMSNVALIYDKEQCSEDIKCPPSFECNLKTSACCLQESIIENGNCLEGWERHSEACYLFRSDLQIWNDANTECMQFSGHLADIQNNAELEYIGKRMHNAWIGDRHYINTEEENIITEEQGCPTLTHLFIKDSSIHHSKEECLYLRPYVCKYYIKSDDNEIHPMFELNEDRRR